jgi:hypothetical protein
MHTRKDVTSNGFVGCMAGECVCFTKPFESTNFHAHPYMSGA